MKYQYVLSIGLSNAEHKKVVDHPADVTEDQVNEDYKQWCDNFMDGGFWKLEAGEEGESE